jgi:hypothetical protein
MGDVVTWLIEHMDTPLAILLYRIQNTKSKEQASHVLDAIRRLESKIEDQNIQRELFEHNIKNILTGEAQANGLVNLKESKIFTIDPHGDSMTTFETDKSGGLKISEDRINNQKGLLMDEALKLGETVSIGENLMNLNGEYDLVIKDRRIIKVRAESKKELTNYSPIGNKRIVMSFAHTDHHFTEINDGLAITEPFENSWRIKLQPVLLKGLRGKLYTKIERNGTLIKKEKILELPKTKHLKKLMVVSMNFDKLIKTELFLDNYNKSIASYSFDL